jgi:hypothetical protein
MKQLPTTGIRLHRFRKHFSCYRNMSQISLADINDMCILYCVCPCTTEQFWRRVMSLNFSFMQISSHNRQVSLQTKIKYAWHLLQYSYSSILFYSNLNWFWLRIYFLPCWESYTLCCVDIYTSLYYVFTIFYWIILHNILHLFLYNFPSMKHFMCVC